MHFELGSALHVFTVGFGHFGGWIQDTLAGALDTLAGALDTLAGAL